MVYQVYLERRAWEDIGRLPKPIPDQAAVKVRSLKDNPRPPGCRKIAGSHSDWRIRLGNYRILYEIDDAAKRVNVMHIRHRREAYR